MDTQTIRENDIEMFKVITSDYKQSKSEYYVIAPNFEEVVKYFKNNQIDSVEKVATQDQIIITPYKAIGNQ